MTNTDTRREIRREDDDELLGFVTSTDAAKHDATTVFGGLLGTHDTADDAVTQVRAIGLSSLAVRWWILADGKWQHCHLIEASPERVLAVIATYAWEAPPQVIAPGTPLQLAEPPTA